MNYRLLYDTGTGYRDLDLGDEKPAMNYQINNLNELKDRQAAFSQAIKLPKTPNNLRSLGFIDDFDVVADAAYIPRKCRLLCNGALLTPFGSVLYVDGVDEREGGYITCQIVSGTKDLFSAMADVSNEDMGDADLWGGVWTSGQMESDNENTNDRRRWPLVFTQEGVSTYIPPVAPFQSEQIQIYHMVPCYHYNTLIKELLGKYGYNLESNLLDDPYVDRLYISASKIKNKAMPAVRYEQKGVAVPNKYITGSSSPFPASSIIPKIIQEELIGGNVEVKNEYNPGFPLSQMRYYAVQPGNYKVDISIVNTGSYGTDNERRIDIAIASYSNGAEHVLRAYSNRQISAGATYAETVEDIYLNVGDYIAVAVNIWATRTTTLKPTYLNFNTSIDLMDASEEPGVGAQFDYMQSTGFKSYKEVVQSYMQLFGAMVDVKQTQETGEEENRRIGTVRIYTFDELYCRRDAGQFVDWSDRLVLDSERTAGFSIANYAQQNLIELTANSDDGTQDSGKFSVNNKTLEGEKTLFTIPVEAGRDISYSADGVRRTVAVIPTLERDAETSDNGTEEVTLTYKGCAPHLVRMTYENIAVSNASGFRVVNPGDAGSQMLPVAVTVPMQTLVDSYYARIKGMLHNAKTLSAYFNLSALDIDQLDLFTPIWIKRYGAYFYISKINNFIAGQVTKVDLIKM